MLHKNKKKIIPYTIKLLSISSLAVIILLAISACATSTKPMDNQTDNGTASPNFSTANEITVAAASDLTNAFTEIGKLFEQQTGTKVTFSFGSTGQLADQIENGAPFDVFAAANVSFLDRLIDSGDIIPDSKQLYAIGRVVFVTHKDSSFAVDDFSNVLDDDVKVIAIANPDHAPYGLAAKEVLQTAGFWDAVESKLVFGRNVSETLTLVETRNADVGIIALSILNRDILKHNILDAELHNPLLQAIGINSRTNNTEAAQKFLAYINGEHGRPIMDSYGFMLP